MVAGYYMFIKNVKRELSLDRRVARSYRRADTEAVPIVILTTNAQLADIPSIEG